MGTSWDKVALPPTLLPHGISSCPLPAHGESLGMSENCHDNTGPLPPGRRGARSLQQETPLRLPSLLVLSHWGQGAAGQQVELGLSLGGAGLWPQAKPRHPALASSVDTCAP